MLFKAALMTAVAGLMVCRAATAPTQGNTDDQYCIPKTCSHEEQETAWNNFVQDFYVTKDISKAYHSYVLANYIDHNPYTAEQGAAPAVEFLAPLIPTLNITILRTAFQDGLGWIHIRADNYAPKPTAVVDIYKFEDGCISEHWDVIQTLPDDAVNPVALF